MCCCNAHICSSTALTFELLLPIPFGHDTHLQCKCQGTRHLIGLCVNRKGSSTSEIVRAYSYGTIELPSSYKMLKYLLGTRGLTPFQEIEQSANKSHGMKSFSSHTVLITRGPDSTILPDMAQFKNWLIISLKGYRGCLIAKEQAGGQSSIMVGIVDHFWRENPRSRYSIPNFMGPRRRSHNFQQQRLLW